MREKTSLQNDNQSPQPLLSVVRETTACALQAVESARRESEDKRVSAIKKHMQEYGAEHFDVEVIDVILEAANNGKYFVDIPIVYCLQTEYGKYLSEYYKDRLEKEGFKVEEKAKKAEDPDYVYPIDRSLLVSWEKD